MPNQDDNKTIKNVAAHRIYLTLLLSNLTHQCATQYDTNETKGTPPGAPDGHFNLLAQYELRHTLRHQLEQQI